MKRVLTGIAAALLASCASTQRTAGPASPSTAAEQRAAERTVVVDPSTLDPDRIRLLQRTLVDHGFAIDMTGSFDPPTRTALTTFQRARGLPATGNLNGPTMDALGIDPRDLQGPEGTAGAAPRQRVPAETGTGIGSSDRGPQGAAGTGAGPPADPGSLPRPR